MILVYDDLLQRNIYIHYGEEPNSVLIDMKKVQEQMGYDAELSNDDFNCQGCCFRLPNRDILIWTKYREPSVLCHEAVHAASMLLGILPSPFDSSTEEIYCRYVEMIIRKVLDDCNNVNKESSIERNS